MCGKSFVTAPVGNLGVADRPVPQNRSPPNWGRAVVYDWRFAIWLHAASLIGILAQFQYFAVQTAILHSFGDGLWGYHLGFAQIRDGRSCARAESPVRRTAISSARSPASSGAQSFRARGHFGAVEAPAHLNRVGALDHGANMGGRLARVVGAHLFIRHGGDFGWVPMRSAGSAYFCSGNAGSSLASSAASA